MVERVLRMHEVPESMPGSSGFFFLYNEVKNFPPLIGTYGGFEEREIYTHEVRESMPVSSRFYFLRFQDCIKS